MCILYFECLLGVLCMFTADIMGSCFLHQDGLMRPRFDSDVVKKSNEVRVVLDCSIFADELFVESPTLVQWVPSLKLTANAPENRPKPNRKGSYYNHPFVGAFAVSFREGRIEQKPLSNCFIAIGGVQHPKYSFQCGKEGIFFFFRAFRWQLWVA